MYSMMVAIRRLHGFEILLIGHRITPLLIPVLVPCPTITEMANIRHGIVSVVIPALCLQEVVEGCSRAAFIPSHNTPRKSSLLLPLSSSADPIDPQVSAKFKILTCSATSCAQKRNALGMDQYATFSAFYTRIKDADFPNVQLDETSCLGGCKLAPCVAVEHDDFEGTVALEGMTANEFSDRVFYGIITEEDADRVWSCIDTAIRVMADEHDEDFDIDAGFV